jgi:ornithine lipid ester-linked acyl 2-hydroxylase
MTANNDVDVAAPDEPQGFLPRAIIALDRKLCSYYARASAVGNREFFDVEDFPWVKAIEADWRKVRAELDALRPYVAHMPNFQDIQKGVSETLTQGDDWKTFFFYAYGLKMVGNCRRCPETTRLLQKMPGMKTAFFSILAPGMHLPPHRLYKGVLRLHLGLIIPEPAEMCAIRVGSQIRHWQEGRVMIFDDVFEHEAWNRTDEVRVVLFVDIMRPMSVPANMLNSVMTWVIAFSPLVLSALGNYFRWEKRFEAITNQDAGRSRNLLPDFLKSINGIRLGK